jgi:O-antigen/teichoic acid export membrane protein
MAKSEAMAMADPVVFPRRAWGVLRSETHGKILGGSLIMLVSTVIVMAVNFGYQVDVAQRLGPAEFGHVAVSVTLLLLASSLMLAFQIVCAKFIAKSQSADDKVAVYHRLRRRAWQVGIGIGVLLAVFARPISTFLQLPNIWMMEMMAVGIAFYIPLGVKRGAFQGECAFTRLGTNFMIEAIGKFVFALIAILFWGALGAVAAIAVSEVVAYFLPRTLPLYLTKNGKQVRIASAEGMQAIIFFIGQVVILNTDLLLVKHFFSPADAGRYAAVAMVGRVLFYAGWQVTATMFPVSAEVGRKGGRSVSLLAIPITLIVSLYLGCLGVLAVFPSLLKVVFGPGFQQAQGLLGLYAANTTLYSVAVAVMAFEISRRVANTGWLQLVFAGFVVGGITLFHENLHQVVIVLLALTSVLLLAVTVPFLRRHSHAVAAEIEQEAA